MRRKSTSMEKDEPDWDYSYNVPTARDWAEAVEAFNPLAFNDSIERERSSSLREEEPRRNAKQAVTSSRKMSHLELLCANHECAIQQEPDSLYYQTITSERIKRRPEPRNHHREQTILPPGASMISRTLPRDTVETKVRTKPTSKRKEPRVASESARAPLSGDVSEVPLPEIIIPRNESPPNVMSSMPPRKTMENNVRTKSKSTSKQQRVSKVIPERVSSHASDVTEGPVPEIAFRREGTSPSVGCRMPSLSLGSLMESQSNVATKSTSPTSVQNIVDELTDLQDQLDALRMIQPTISREPTINRQALLGTTVADEDTKSNADVSDDLSEARGELVDDFPKLQQDFVHKFPGGDEELIQNFPNLDEELIDGVPFLAFGSERDAPEAIQSPFFALVDALHKRESPRTEEAFADPGVRLRRFGSEKDTPHTSISITIEKVPEESSTEPTRKEPEIPTKTKSKVSSLRDAPGDLPGQDHAAVQEPELLKKIQAKSRPSTGRDSPEVPSRRKTKSKSPSSSKSSGDTPPKKSFSIRGALASVRGKSSFVPPAIVEVPAQTKSVRFSEKLVTSVQYRPKTLPHEIEDLYFSQEELIELERDRQERVYEEQFEIVAGDNKNEVAVTYPVRRVDATQTPPPVVVELSPPDLVDISGSWSEGSEDVLLQVFEI